MGEYLKTVVAAVLAVSMISMLFPKGGFGQFANLLTGIIVLAVIFAPLLNLDKKLLPDIDTIDVEELELASNSYLMEEFEKELAEKTAAELKKKTKVDFSVAVRASDEGETVEIHEVELWPYSQEYVNIVSEYLGVGEDRVTQK